MFVLSRFSTLLVLLLSAALVMAQMLGAVHGTAHGPAASLIHASGHATDDDHEHRHGQEPNDAHKQNKLQNKATASSSSQFVISLFSSHQTASDCSLYDLASPGGALLAVAHIALPAVLPPLAVAIFAGEALARWAALFDARGPPMTV